MDTVGQEEWGIHCVGLDSRENESIAVEPLGALGVEVHELVEKDVGDRCHAPSPNDVSTLLV